MGRAYLIGSQALAHGKPRSTRDLGGQEPIPKEACTAYATSNYHSRAIAQGS